MSQFAESLGVSFFTLAIITVYVMLIVAVFSTWRTVKRIEKVLLHKGPPQEQEKKQGRRALWEQP